MKSHLARKNIKDIRELSRNIVIKKLWYLNRYTIRSSWFVWVKGGYDIDNFIFVSGTLEKGVTRSFFKKIRKVFMGIFNTFLSFSSNACKEIVECVCNFSWFCTCRVIRY